MMKIWMILFLFLTLSIYSNELKKYEYTSQDNDFLVAFQLEEEAEVESFMLKNPFRLVMTIKNTKLNPKLSSKKEVNNHIIKTMMLVQYNRNSKPNTKIILSLKSEATYSIDKFNNKVMLTLKNVNHLKKETEDIIAAIETHEAQEASNKNTQEDQKAQNKTSNKNEDQNSAMDIIHFKSDEDETEDTEDDETLKSKKEIAKEQEQKKHLKAELEASLKKDISLKEKAPKITSDIQLKASNKANFLIKTVFKKYANKARIIIKTKHTANYQTELEGNVFRVILPNTSFLNRLANLPLDTEFFKTNVKKIVPKKRGKVIVLTLYLVKGKEPEITQVNEELYLDF